MLLSEKLLGVLLSFQQSLVLLIHKLLSRLSHLLGPMRLLRLRRPQRLTTFLQRTHLQELDSRHVFSLLFCASLQFWLLVQSLRKRLVD